MATTPPLVDPKTVVRTSERLWSEEVAVADACDVIQPKNTAYEFSNGRRFVENFNPYEEPTP